MCQVLVSESGATAVGGLGRHFGGCTHKHIFYFDCLEREDFAAEMHNSSMHLIRGPQSRSSGYYLEGKRAHGGASFVVACLSESQDTRLVAGVQSSSSSTEEELELHRTSADS